MPTARHSLRQAIVVLDMPPILPFLGEPISPSSGMLQASSLLLRDVIGALVAINGVSIVVVARPGTAAGDPSARLPAGVELVVVRERSAAGDIAHEALRRHFEHDDSPVLVLAGDTIGCGVRNAATALSTLARADSAIGLSVAGGVYAVAVRSVEVAASLHAQGWLGALETGGAAPESLPGPPMTVSRSLARLHRGGDSATIDELRTVVASAPTAMPRIAAALGLPHRLTR
ncbi:MAG: DUF2064 domain-containing protein [Thermomicrobiales bacterium]